MGEVKTLLFLEHSAHRAGWFIRPVLWDDPDASLMPTHIEPSASALEWLIKHGVPVWYAVAGKPSGLSNCRTLYATMGRMPEPFLAKVEKLQDYHFNDSLEVINGR